MQEMRVKNTTFRHQAVSCLWMSPEWQQLMSLKNDQCQMTYPDRCSSETANPRINIASVANPFCKILWCLPTAPVSSWGAMARWDEKTGCGSCRPAPSGYCERNVGKHWPRPACSLPWRDGLEIRKLQWANSSSGYSQCRMQATKKSQAECNGRSLFVLLIRWFNPSALS